MGSHIYLSGPMSGLPELNYPAFKAAAFHLRNADFVDDVFNPAEWEERNDCKFDLHKAFEDYCNYIIWKATMVVLLPGWENSPGATAESALARALGKPVFAYSKQTGWATLNGPDDHDHPTLFVHL